jgi:hypothetical protein
LLLIEHITSINAPRLCIMHNPCCPVLLEAVCARSPLKQYKEILLLAVAACELPAATVLAVQLILHSFTIPQIIPIGICHSPGL